jgi:replicative DNA helicase
MKARKEKDVQKALDEITRDVFELTSESVNAKGFTSVSALNASALDNLRNGKRGLNTGFVDVDRISGGLMDGALWIIGARPGAGKSAFVLNVAANVAKKGTPVALLSLEMGYDEIMERIYASEARVDVGALKQNHGKTHAFDPAFRRIEKAANEIAAWNLFVDEGNYSSISALRAAARKFVKEHKKVSGHAVIIVDYLQLMQDSDESAENRNLEISKITRNLKLLAMELKVTIIALSQLSRKCEERQDKRPLLSDLRDSGSIEQDANVVAFLYRPELYYQKDPKSGASIAGDAELIIAKNRSGLTGVADLHFEGALFRFENASDREDVYSEAA